MYVYTQAHTYIDSILDMPVDPAVNLCRSAHCCYMPSGMPKYFPF